MNIRLWSDLHLEFAPFHPKVEGFPLTDVIVLAGDIGVGGKGLRWARTTFPNHRLIYVAGNHEFYGGGWNRTLDLLRAAAILLDIDFLENDQVEIDGVRFLGCSLWSDFEYFGAEHRAKAMRDYERGLSDCWSIALDEPIPSSTGGSRKLTAGDVLHRHQQSHAWLTQTLALPHPKTVVVTHHAPNVQSVAPRYLHDELTPGFASHLSEKLVSSADLWIHGHMHNSADYLVAGAGGRATRVICNSRGYPSRRGAFENDNFQDEFFVEV
jgi:Calcineurin-like phosphoesterase